MLYLATLLTPILEQAAATGDQGAPAGPLGACAGGGSSQMLVFVALFFGIFYFLIIRPNQKREKERQNMLSTLSPGTQVLTTGGLVGKITGTSDRYVVLEISPKVRVKVLRTQIAGADEGEEKKEKKGSGKKSKGSKGDKKRGKSSDVSSKTSDSDAKGKDEEEE